ncbi:hypothetical protein BIY22_19235 [Vibrio panuliri]|uniref:Peptidase C39 domain-containing protein n=1 Tax=Vibrio panuliri TaxID=1381081 RepID=A0A1Q9HHU6_9VIBR|nr:hypothetical protein [Vibrio panuliri]OLQ89653.1 hypothetical protein BIY22_19235 [Vibrio panuliri]
MGNIDKMVMLPSQGQLGFDYGCGLVSLAYVFFLLGHIRIDELKATIAKLVSANGNEEKTHIDDLIKASQSISIKGSINIEAINNPFRYKRTTIPMGKFLLVPVWYYKVRHWIVVYQDQESLWVIDPWKDNHTWYERFSMAKFYSFYKSSTANFYRHALLIESV